MRNNFKILSAILFTVMSIFADNSALAGGSGSQNNPYTCADVISLNNPGTKAWIKGYIVGTMNTKNSTYKFEINPPFFFYANIYLADNPYETDPAKCVPVQLATGSAARAQLNLGDNPGKHRALYALQGDLLAYFDQPGLKNIDGFTELATAPDDPTGGIDPDLIFDLTISTPGTLQNKFAALDAEDIQGLVIKGMLNSDDIIFLKSGPGRIASVKYLDLSKVTFDYDGKRYATTTAAPEAGMGAKYTYNYILSENNYDKELPFDFIAGYSTDCYRNNLAYALSENNAFETVILPNCLTSIGEGIMYSCEKLKSVTLPPDITAIGDMAFGACSAPVIKGLTSSVKRIGDYAFLNATIDTDILKLDNTVIGEGAFSYSKGFPVLEIINHGDTIPPDAFSNCHGLRGIKIGEGVKYIATRAFKSSAIETAELPTSLEEVGVNAFNNCPFLNSLPVENNIRYLGSIAYELTNTSLNEYTIREGTKSLAHELFWGASKRPKVNLPSSIEIIGKQSLSQINITTLPELPNLRRIGDRAFEYCPLTSVVIPEKVELIHYNAFLGCDKIWKVNYKAIRAEIADNRLIFENVVEQVTLGDKVEYIPIGLFTGNNFITEINLPASVNSLAPGAFEGCSKLEHINLNDNITEIQDGTFYGCESLRKIHWPAHLKSVDKNAFRNCSSLETISLPEGFTTLGYSAFSGCSCIKTLYIPSTLEESDYAYNFDIKNPTVEHLTVTCTAETPYNMYWSLSNMAKTTFRVPAASLDKYKSDPNWNYSYNSEYSPVIIAIESLSAPKKDSQTNFSKSISSDTDLTDTVLGDVYVTLGENDGYDDVDGAIMLVDTMADEYVDAIGGMTPGQSDLANRFNGLVVQVPAGTGKIIINCLTLGDKYISVKIGDEEPLVYTNIEKGDITIEYNVAEDTYIYIYATANAESLKSTPLSRYATPSGSCVKIYSIGINPELLGIDCVFDDDTTRKSIIEYWRLDGIKVDKPQIPGIYIGRCSNGSIVKLHVK